MSNNYRVLAFVILFMIGFVSYVPDVKAACWNGWGCSLARACCNSGSSCGALYQSCCQNSACGSGLVCISGKCSTPSGCLTEPAGCYKKETICTVTEVCKDSQDDSVCDPLDYYGDGECVCNPITPEECPDYAKQNTNTLTTTAAKSDFAYYLPSPKCTKIGSCACPTGTDAVTPVSDFTTTEAACKCITDATWTGTSCCGYAGGPACTGQPLCGGTSYNSATQKCCGDVIKPIGETCPSAPTNPTTPLTFQQGDCPTSGYTCDPYVDLPANPVKAKIAYLEKTKSEYIAMDSTTWDKCDKVFESNKNIRKNITADNKNHTFLCTGKGEGSIVECQGEGASISTGDGQRIKIGESVKRGLPNNPIPGECKPGPVLCDGTANANCACPKDKKIVSQKVCKKTNTLKTCTPGACTTGTSVTSCPPPASDPLTGRVVRNPITGNFVAPPLDTCGDTTCNEPSETCTNCPSDCGECPPPPADCGALGQDCCTTGTACPGLTCNSVSGKCEAVSVGECCTCSMERKTDCTTEDQKETVYSCEACTDDGSPCYNCTKPTEPITDTSTYYCNADTRFVKDLDYYIPNVDKKPVRPFNAEDYCSNSSNSKEMCKKTCEAAGFSWTGTKCCSEDDDNLTETAEGITTFFTCLNDPTKTECYNDKISALTGTEGGCWNSTIVPSFDSVSENPPTKNSVMNYNGEFYGCAIRNDSNPKLKKPTPGFRNFNTENDILIQQNPLSFGPILDKYIINRRLIKDRAHCNLLEKSPLPNAEYYYCAYNETWIYSTTKKENLSYAPPVPSLITDQKNEAGCCEEFKCWNGRTCSNNQKNDPKGLPLATTNFRCIDGNWVASSLKRSLDGRTGYCGNESQCLLDPDEEDINKQCIDSGQYIEDNYCESGNWSSRTKLVALKMMKIKETIGRSSDFTLFCDDSKDNTLNYLAYSVQTGQAAAALAKLNPNNFCVLNVGTRTFVGVSLNKRSEELSANTLQVLGGTSCSSTANDRLYNKCTSSNSKLWYNRNLSIMVYSNTDITPSSIQDASERNPATLILQLKQIINIPFNSVVRGLGQALSEEDTGSEIPLKFDRLYMAKQGTKAINAFLEGSSHQAAVIQYNGFTTSNICQQIDKYAQGRTIDEDSGISCSGTAGNYYVYAYGQIFTNIKPSIIWPDLTSKLRLT